MKRLMILTAVVCMAAALTGCSNKPSNPKVIETLPEENSAVDSSSDPLASDDEGETETQKKKTTETIPAEFAADEDMNEDLVGTWKYTYDEGMDAYYIIDSDHSLVSMIDLSLVMHVDNGKLLVGSGKDVRRLSFKKQKDHYIASVQNMVFLDIVPREDADTDTMQGDFDLYESILFPQDEEETKKDEDGNAIQSHTILRFVENQSSLVEMGLCYCSDEQLVFMTDKKKLLVDYKFKKDDKNVLILEDEEAGEITLKRIVKKDGLTLSEAETETSSKKNN